MWQNLSQLTGAYLNKIVVLRIGALLCSQKELTSQRIKNFMIITVRCKVSEACSEVLQLDMRRCIAFAISGDNNTKLDWQMKTANGKDPTQP